MGRRAQGVTFRVQRGIWTARFRIAGHRHEVSTGFRAEPGQRRPSETVTRAGEQAYAAAIQGGLRRPAARAGVPVELAPSFAAWTLEAAVRPLTRQRYREYVVDWLREWRSSAELTESALATYFRRRLGTVVRKTAQSELGALRSWARWAVDVGDLATPLTVPDLPKGALGTPATVRRRVRAPELSADEIERILARLPEWSSDAHPRRYAVRARFKVMFDTTLRPATLDRLRVPEHWAPGERTVRVEADSDKEGFARDVPLTARAQAALARVAPANGLVFGRHQYARFLSPAAAAVLPPAKARIFTGQHVRSAAITRALERSSNLAGTMYLAGHKHAATTSRYVRASHRAAVDVLRAISGDAPPKRTPRRPDTGEAATGPSEKAAGSRGR